MRYRLDDGSIKQVLDKVTREQYPALVATHFKILFDTKEQYSKLGSVRKISEREKCSGVNADILLIIAEAWWRVKDESAREALIDHELAHIHCITTEDGSIQYKMLKHDIEEFIGVVDRRGAWSPALNSLKEMFTELFSR